VRAPRKHRGAGQVIGIDRLPERLQMARDHGIDTIEIGGRDGAGDLLREGTDGRAGPTR